MPEFNIEDFGAEKDSNLVNNTSIQRAIDTCYANGGGRVVVPASGSYVSGTIVLKDNVELHLETGALLKASTDPGDYEETNLAGEYGGNSGGFLITAHNASNISITGEGTIDGQCEAFMDGWWTDDGKYIKKPKEFRTRIIGLFGCRNVTIKGITVQNSAQWTCHLTGCEEVDIDSVTIRNGLDVPNCDGIDPDHCRNVRIKDCTIESGDDCIVIKTTKEFSEHGPSENIHITGCTLISTSSAIKLGSESVDDIRNITVENCTIKRSHRGLAIQLRDKGDMEHIHMKDCEIETRKFHDKYWGNGEAIYITAVERHDGLGTGHVRDVVFSNIRFKSENGVFIYASESAKVQNVTLDRIQGTLEKTSRFPITRMDLRPRHSQEHGGLVEGKLSAITAIGVEGLTIRNSRIQFREEDRDHWNQELQTEDVGNLLIENFNGSNDAENTQSGAG